MSERLRIYDGISVRGQFLDVDIYPTTDGMVRIGFSAPIKNIPSLNGRRMRLGNSERTEEYDRNRLVLDGCTLTCTASPSANVPQYREQVVVDLDEDVASDLRELLPMMFNIAGCSKTICTALDNSWRRIAEHEHGLVTQLVAYVVLDQIKLDDAAEFVMVNWNSANRELLLAALSSKPVFEVLAAATANSPKS